MKKLLVSAVFLLMGIATSFAEAIERSVTYNVSSVGEITVTGDELSGREVEFKNTYGNSNRMTAGNKTTLNVKNFGEYTITGLILRMYSNPSSGSGKFYFKIGDKTIAEISSSTTFNKWYDNEKYTSTPTNISVLFNNDYKKGYDVAID